jgi:hypothetical protein
MDDSLEQARGASGPLTAILALAIAGPPLVLFAGTVVMLALAASGRHPLWRVEPVTIAEAAALKDAGTVRELVERGADASHPARVRAHIVERVVGGRGGDVEWTAFEAAIAGRRGEIVAMLLALGARPDERERRRLGCLARNVGAPDIARIFEPLGTGAESDDCAGVPVPW